ncbi:UPF0149 family protein [Methylomonas paludis]|uniref:UPF0149 family protein n=2 Tax=Methylomonas paludis TaxID=1173101 RepID=A0A975MRA1_9GAMM|nr:UPF0149 family protein [Methylomonas paludis]
MGYQSISEILISLDADFEAAEAHGVAVGMLSIAIQADADNWLQLILSDYADIPAQYTEPLLDLFEKTRKVLANGLDEFGFDLLLPDDDEPLAEQSEALRAWCLGFLFGVGYLRSQVAWPGEVAEIMQDIVEITKLDTNIENGDDEDANALMELREYLRTAVLTVKDYFPETLPVQSH